MIASVSKLLLCAAALTLSAAPQSSQSSALNKAPVLCTSSSPLSFDISFYQAQTRKSLEKLGANNHPVGLYWLAEADLRRADKDAAIEKLQRAADQGLADAYFRLGEIYKADKKHAEARQARLCAEGLSPES